VTDDLERLLKSALQQVGGDYHPTDPAAARERYLAARRRRRFYAMGEAAFATALIVAIGLFVSQANLGSDSRIDLSTSGPRVIASIPAGRAPVAVAVGEGAVWMTDAESGSIQKIDPATDEVLATVPLGGATPDEVAVGLGSVWASDTSGSVYKIDPVSLQSEPYRFTDGDDVHLDIAVSDDDLWAVDPASGSVYTLRRGPQTTASDEGFQPTDVGADGSEVWGYDPVGGFLRPLDLRLESKPGSAEAALLRSFSVPTGDQNSDLALGFGAAWIATGSEGEIHRVSLDSGEVTSETIGGEYADLTVDVDQDAVWVLAIDRSADRSVLYELDARTGQVVGESLMLDDAGADVSAGEGSVWVPGTDGGVLKIAPEDDEAVTDDPSPTQDPVQDDLVFVYETDGDLWARYAGGTERLTDTEQLESSPAVSADERYVVFERRNEPGDDSQLVTLDLRSGEECCAIDGAEPAVGPNGQLAYVVEEGMSLPSNGATALQPYIAFSRIGSSVAESFPVYPQEIAIPGMNVTELVWDQSGQVMFIESEYEGRSIRTADLILDKDQIVTRMLPSEIIPTEGLGTRFMAPSVGTTLNFVSACCETVEGAVSGEGFSFHEMEASPELSYENRELADLSDLEGFDGPSFTAFLGEYGVDSRGDLVPSDVTAWLIGDGQDVWLVDLDGNLERIDLTAQDVAAPYPYFD
jgi:streptogramin lyase